MQLGVAELKWRRRDKGENKREVGLRRGSKYIGLQILIKPIKIKRIMIYKMVRSERLTNVYEINEK